MFENHYSKVFSDFLQYFHLRVFALVPHLGPFRASESFHAYVDLGAFARPYSETCASPDLRGGIDPEIFCSNLPYADGRLRKGLRLTGAFPCQMRAAVSSREEALVPAIPGVRRASGSFGEHVCGRCRGRGAPPVDQVGQPCPSCCSCLPEKHFWPRCTCQVSARSKTSGDPHSGWSSASGALHKGTARLTSCSRKRHTLSSSISKRASITALSGLCPSTQAACSSTSLPQHSALHSFVQTPLILLP